MVTAGANQAYVNCILTLVGPGDQCIVFRPYYFNHVMAIQMTQGPDGLVIGDCNENGIPNLTWLEQTLSSNSTIKVVTLVNPGNPTGVYLEKSLVQRIVDVCGKYKVWLVLDCTYEHFCTNKNDQEDDNFPCWNEAHVIHIFSFSKGHSLAGYRCGYISVSKNAPLNVFDEMLKVQDTIPICASRIAQVAALGALQAGRSWVVEQVSSLTIGRQVILDALSPLNMTMGGSGAMYVMGKLPNGMDDQVSTALYIIVYMR